MLSIIVITYNNYEELILTVNSIDQNLKPFLPIQKIVINGGSCKRTKEFLSENTDILSVSESDRGISDAYNKGINLAEGSYINFLNSGDICISKDYFLNAINFLSLNRDIDLVHGPLIYRDMHIGNIKIGKEISHYGNGTPYAFPTVIIRLSKLKNLGYFDERFKVAMDFDLILRFLKSGSFSRYIDIPSVLMDGTGISSKQEKKALLEKIKSMKNNKMMTLRAIFLTSLFSVKLFLKNFVPKFIINRLRSLRHFKLGSIR